MAGLFTPRNLTISLAAGILGGIALGLAGQFTGSPAIASFIGAIEIFGTIFLRALQMVVVPIVLFSVTAGVANLDGASELGGKLGKVLVFFAFTSFVAVLIGMIYTNLVQPGKGLDPDALIALLPPESYAGAAATQGKIALTAPSTMGEFLSTQVGNILMNPFKALAEANLIAVVFFSMFLGVAILLCGESGRPAAHFFSAMESALMKMVGVVVWLAPLGVFALASKVLLGLGPDVLRPLAKYFLTVVAGLLTHFFVVYPLLVRFLARFPVGRFFSTMREAHLMALASASSNATLPVTMRCLVENAGVDKKSADLVAPLGATINMDGTALYEAVAAMFIAQLVGLELGLQQQFIVFFTATLAAVGAAGIPQAGLVTMVIVFKALGLPLELMALIIVVDRPLDHLRTCVNVTGDMIGAIWLARISGTLKA
ncbi:MAG: dicarboxylate/amino acid:cation symporter [Candidatus Sumerlaeia bacterium]|nr:dicarboxylate/amino acid:cation symporter [Candidatus Sumerlaeia bacterium]